MGTIQAIWSTKLMSASQNITLPRTMHRNTVAWKLQCMMTSTTPPKTQRNFVHSLQRSIQVDLHPTCSISHILPVILCSPALHKWHPYGAHLCKFVDSLKAMVDTLGEELRKFLVVEDFEWTSRRNFTNSTWMKTMVMITVPRLHKNSTVRFVLGIHFPTNVKQLNT
jgi:hypothetical protein